MSVYKTSGNIKMKNIDLEIETENGTAVVEGYTVGIQSVNIFNWFSSIAYETSAKKIIDYLIEKEADEIAVLKSVYVPEEDRNKGYGNSLISNFLDEVGEVSFVFLECDNAESNEISLKEWYKDFGFESFSDIFKLKDVEGIEDLMFLRMD